MPRTSAVLGAATALTLLLAPGALAAAGDPDPAFAGDGIVDVGLGRHASAMAIDPDGRIVVAGTYGPDGSQFDFFLARHAPEGGLDPGFGAGGVRITSFGPQNDEPKAMALDAGGRALVVGSTSSVAAGSQIAVARYTADGDPDMSFSGDGKLVFGVSPGDGLDDPAGIVPLAGGKTMVLSQANVGGSFRLALTRLTSAGEPDASFHGDGTHVVPLPYGISPEAAAAAPGGKIVVTGTIDTIDDVATVVLRLTGAGALDDTFTGDGITSRIIGVTAHLNAVTVAPDGAVVAAGHVDMTGGDDDVLIRRLTPQGYDQAGFGTSGTVTTQVAGGDRAFGVALQPDGKVVVAGRAWLVGAAEQGFVARYGLGGVPDPSFAGDGIARLAPGVTATTAVRANPVAVLPGGRIVAGGGIYPDGGPSTATLFGLAGADVPPAPGPGAPTEPAAPGGSATPATTDGAAPPDGATPLGDASPAGSGPSEGRAGADRTPPLITAVSVRKRRRPAARFTLSEPATVTATLRRRTLRTSARAGRNTLRLGRRRLRPGRYVLRLLAVDAAGNRSGVRVLRFRVRRA